MGVELTDKKRAYLPLRGTFCYLNITAKAPLDKKGAYLLQLLGDKAPPTARDSSEAART